MARAAESSPAKLPFKLRFKAWWEGYDPDDLARLDGEESEDEGPSPQEAEQRAAERERDPVDVALEAKTTAGDGPQSDLPVDPWDDNRIDVAQYIWGPGYCGPGGPEHIIAISKMLALTPELSMAHVGAGLGGPARTLVEEFGVWMAGYSSSEALVAAGNELSTMAGMAKKAPLVTFDPENPEESDRSYDRVLMKDFLFNVEAKQKLLGNIEKALKPDGLFLLIDYVLADESVVATEEYRSWKEGEPEKPFMVTQDELTHMLNEAGFLLRVNEDQSEDQIKLITSAWRGADEVIAKLTKNPEERHLIDTLLTEAELWDRRVRMLKSGQLRICRFLAVKRKQKKGMMSDW